MLVPSMMLTLAAAFAPGVHNDGVTFTPLARMARDSISFFAGNWHCVGGTPAGRKMESNVRFEFVLNRRWLESAHDDVSPGRYHAISYWPTDSAQSPAMVIYDNGGGARRFIRTTPIGDVVVWARDTTERGARMEQFTYRRISAQSYWYAWHVRVSPGGPLILGDSATCNRS